MIEPVYKKNQYLDVKIEDMGPLGEGIAKIDGYAIFVKDAIVLDECQVKIMKVHKTYAYARLEKIITPSPYRVKPKCEVARKCGGCKIMAMDYERQLEYKKEKVLNNLYKIGGLEKGSFICEEIIGMENPYNYRNKAQFPIGYNPKGKIVSGFYAGRTHVIIENNLCHLGVPENEMILNIIKGFMREKNIEPYNEETFQGIIRHVMIRKGFFSGEILICIVINGDDIPFREELVNRLITVEGVKSISLSINKKNTNVIMGKEIKNIYGKDSIQDNIKDLKFNISPKSFFQVNPIQTEKLYDKALEYADLTGNEVVWDLYCGIGSISLFLAKKAKKVYGVEIIKEAIDDAKINAKSNGLDNVEFFVGKSEDVFKSYYEKHKDMKADVVVVDPPRKGCFKTLLDTIGEVKPEKVVYVSCDCATLARDIKILGEYGYEVKKVCPVDMFPHTEHVETVCLMSRVEGK